MTQPSQKRMLDGINKYLRPHAPWEFVDIGCAGGIMLFMARAYGGAALANGIEIKREGQQHIFSHALEVLGYNNPYTVSAEFGRSLAACAKLPTLQQVAASMQTAVYMFSDGWSEDDRQDAFQKAGQDPKVRVFTCCGGKAAGDRYATWESVLKCLNEAAIASSTGLIFHYQETVHIAMYGSGQQKSMFVFSRHS